MGSKLGNLGTDELLKIAIANGIINVDDVRTQLVMEKEKEILDNHPYTIWKGKNESWYTYVKCKVGKKKVRLVKRKKEEDIKQAIIDNYFDADAYAYRNRMTLELLLPEWLRFKSVHTNASSYIKRISTDWFAFYAEDEMIKYPLTTLTKPMLDEWVHRKIKEHGFTKTQYYNMSVILRQALPYAVEKGYIDKNPFEKVKVNSKMFSKVQKKDDEQEVFSVEEQPKIIEEAFKDFEEKKIGICLSIPLCFQIGARIGELICIKSTDIKGNYLHIQRMEVKNYATEDGLNYKVASRDVVDFTKTDAGDRRVYLTTEARRLIDLIIETNRENGEDDQDYLFVQNGKRLHIPAIESRIDKYCRHIGISEKRTHKIRKTYISTLIDNGVNINKVRGQVGHTDERTTYRSYCFNRYTDVQTEKMLEDALVLPENDTESDDITGNANILSFCEIKKAATPTK